MGKMREPIDLILAKGRKHMGREEIERRRAEEIHVPFIDVHPPEYLKGKKAQQEFNDYAEKLLAIGIFTELDVDCLARYILSKALYLEYTSLLTKLIKSGDTERAGKVQTMQDKAFKQCQSCARDLGLTITSRCKLTIPQTDNDEDYEL